MTYNQWLRGLSGKDDSKITIRQESRSMWVVYREFLTPEGVSDIICACRDYRQAQRIARKNNGKVRGK